MRSVNKLDLSGFACLPIHLRVKYNSMRIKSIVIAAYGSVR